MTEAAMENGESPPPLQASCNGENSSGSINCGIASDSQQQKPAQQKDGKKKKKRKHNKMQNGEGSTKKPRTDREASPQNDRKPLHTQSNLEFIFQLGGIPCIFQECSDQFARLTEETLPSHVAARHPEVKTVLGGGPHQVSNKEKLSIKKLLNNKSFLLRQKNKTLLLKKNNAAINTYCRVYFRSKKRIKFETELLL